MTHKTTKKTKEYVKKYASMGVTQQDIAKTLGINRKTLRKHYKEILRNSTTHLGVEVAGLLVDACRNGNVQAQIIFLKTRMGWSESKSQTNHLLK
jgi:DNA-binding XRE family transcriptional regulator